MAGKEDLNMGSSRPSSVFVTLDSVIDRINNKMNLVLMRGNQFVSSMTNGVSKLSGLVGGMPGDSVAQGQNTVMQQPPITIPWQAPGQVIPGQNRVMDIAAAPTGGGGGGIGSKIANFGDGYIADNKIAIGMTAASFAFAATPETREGVYLNYMTNRARFYGSSEEGGPAIPRRAGSDNVPGFIGGPLDAILGGNRKEKEYNEVSALQRRLSTAGTVSGKFDVVEAMARAQAEGMGIATPGFEKTMTGVMQMTNVMPGVTAQEAARGFMRGMQNARSVNMLRFIGIQARDPITGALRSPTEIADQIWNKINREKVGNAKLTAQDLSISLQPGNALASMLDQYFGQDPVARKFVEDALFAKVRGATDYSSGEMERIGGTTQAVRARSERNTRALQTGQQTARAAAGSQALADTIITAEAAFINFIDRITGILSTVSFTKGATETLGGAANNTQGKLLSFLASIFGFGGGLFKAEGGPVEGKVPYIVGEKGPELFVPKVDGTIIPNHDLDGMTREGGGDVSKMGADLAGSSKGLSNKQLRQILQAAGFKGKNIDTAMAVVRAESGGRPGALNPDASTGDYSMGIFQINMIGNLGRDRNKQYLEKHKDIGYTGPESLYNPYINAVIAKDLSGGKNFTKHWVNTSRKLGLTGPGSTPTATPSPGPSYSSFSNVTTGSGSSFSDWLEKYGPKSGNQFGTAMPGGSTFGVAGTGSTNNNYSVVINIKDAKDAKSVAREVKKILEDPTNKARN